MGCVELYATCLAADTCLCIPMFMLQRDAIVGHTEAIRTQSRNHQRHTHTRNASLPTQANHTVRGARKQPPNWALHMQLAKIPVMIRHALAIRN